MNWTIDSAHTTAGFKVRHLGLTNVRGTFSGVSGTIETDDQGRPTSVKASIPVKTVNTGNADRDGHLQGADFFDAAAHPSIEFVSTSVTPSGDGYDIQGHLTMHGVTKPVTLKAEVSAPVTDPFSQARKIGGEATIDISRKDFGLTWNAALETGGVMVADKVQIHLEVEAVQA